MRSTFITVMGWAFLFACVLTSLLIVVKSVARFRRAREGVAKAIIALIVWVILSIGNLVALTGYAAGETIADELPLKLGTAELSVAGALLLYLAAGCGLIYWITPGRNAN